MNNLEEFMCREKEQELNAKEKSVGFV